MLSFDQMFCQAPSVNLNFSRDGSVTACCYNRKFRLGSYPASTIQQIWDGAPIQELRSLLNRSDLSKGCDLCREQLEAGNFAGVRARFFDPVWFTERASQEEEILHPKMLEFELANTCNLECTMCSGHFSSRIRRNREGLPPLPMVYDDAFVEQLRPFLARLEWAKFLGGEPFLIPLYYRIWDLISAVNPKIRSVITTNGTVLNDRIKDVLATLRPSLVLSVDSLKRETYEEIRRPARFDRLTENLAFFITFARRHDLRLDFAVCPLRANWRELPALVSFCNVNELPIFFNTVVWPPELALKTLPSEELKTIVAELGQSRMVSGSPRQSEANRQAFSELLSQLAAWSAPSATIGRELTPASAFTMVPTAP